MLNLDRSKLVKGVAACGFVSVLLLSTNAFAEWPSKVFDSKNKIDVISELYGDVNIEPSTQIDLKIPKIAENGAVVPINIKTDLPNVESVSIIVEENPHPLIAQFAMQSGNKGTISTRIKLAKDSNVTAIIKSNGKLYSITDSVKVTVPGCGG